MPDTCWLFKTEPEVFSWDMLKARGKNGEPWDGVRNFQARNLLRDELKAGDGVLFYASNADPSGVTGLAAVEREGYPDPFAFRQGHRYHDPKSDPASPSAPPPGPRARAPP